jgi:hypothetical protein
MAGIGSDDESDEETQEATKTRREWATVARKHANEWENVGRSCLLFSKAGLGIYIVRVRVRVRVRSDTMYATQRECGGGERKVEVERSVLPATERAASYAERVRYPD